jgi:chromosome segregation ATPase
VNRVPPSRRGRVAAYVRPVADPETGNGAAAPGSEAPQKRRNRWIWVSALLAIVAVGVTIWALTLRSDADNTQQDLDKTTQELASTKQELDTTKKQLASAQQDVQDLQSSQRRRTGVALVTGKVLYDEFAKQLGAAHDELAATQQDVEDADKAAMQAEQDAEAAKQDAADASTETDKAEAEAKQAKAESQAAQSRAEAARGCAKAYIEAFGGLFEGDSASAQAEIVRKDLQSVTSDCKDALAAA